MIYVIGAQCEADKLLALISHWRIGMPFIETPIFTEDVKEFFSNEEYQPFQQYLADNPTEGDVIPHTGGLRKIRWILSGKGKGKRGWSQSDLLSRRCNRQYQVIAAVCERDKR